MAGERTVGEVGEAGLVAAVTARLGQGEHVLLGPGDDAALVTVPDGRVLATTDVLVEGRHFRRDWSSAADVGHKSAAASLADVAAMGGVATALLVGLALPADVPEAWALELAEGLRAEAEVVGASVVGGDVVRADAVMVAVTALGTLQGRAVVTRAGARPGDVVAVAGGLGWSAAGLAVLSRGFRSPRSLVEAHRRPRPPYDAGPEAALLGASAMCDVSDGLVRDLGHVAAASGVAIELRTEAFDVPEALGDVGRALGADPLGWVLGGGEDHALVACFSAGAPLPARWRVVGSVAAGEGVRVDGAGWEDGGFDHFRT